MPMGWDIAKGPFIYYQGGHQEKKPQGAITENTSIGGHKKHTFELALSHGGEGGA